MNFIRYSLTAFLSTAATALLFLPTESYAAPPAVGASCADDPIGSIAQFRDTSTTPDSHISLICDSGQVWRQFQTISDAGGASTVLI